LGKVVVGSRLDDKFTLQMRDQTGLDNTVLVSDQPVATSLDGGFPYHQSARSAATDGAAPGTFTLDGRPYYATRFTLSSPSQGEAGNGPECL
jgi:hypothetical protein